MPNKSKTLIPGDEQRRQLRLRQLRNWAILLGVIALVVIITILVTSFGSRSTSISAHSLPCYADQDVTIFQDGVLYYNNASIIFINTAGGVEWSYPVGSGASFSTSDTHLIVWSGNQLSIVDANGKSSYNRAMDEAIQFCRIGKNHAAIVTGSPLNATVYIKDLQGAQVDFETDIFDGQFMLDCGFYGDRGEYLWTLSYDYYNPVVTSLLHTFQVDQKNTGIATISDHLPRKVIYVNNGLNVFTTQQMYAFDYKGVADPDNTLLVYGWKYLNHDDSSRGSANILLAPTKQTDDTQAITELRVLSTTLDCRYTLPSACVGAALKNDRIFAFSSEYLYSGRIDSQRFYAYQIPLPDGRQVSEYIGLTSNGYAIVTSGSEVYSVSLPR